MMDRRTFLKAAITAASVGIGGVGALSGNIHPLPVSCAGEQVKGLFAGVYINEDLAFSISVIRDGRLVLLSTPADMLNAVALLREIAAEAVVISSCVFREERTICEKNPWLRGWAMTYWPDYIPQQVKGTWESISHRPSLRLVNVLRSAFFQQAYEYLRMERLRGNFWAHFAGSGKQQAEMTFAIGNSVQAQFAPDCPVDGIWSAEAAPASPRPDAKRRTRALAAQ